MNLRDIIGKLITGREHKQIEQGVEAVKNIYEGTDSEETIKKATDRIIEEIEANPDMSVKQFFKMIEQEDLPTEILVEATKQMPEVTSERTTVELVQELDLPSTGIKDIIKAADVSLDAAIMMAKEIPDRSIQKAEKIRLERLEKKRREKSIKEKLKTMYIMCDEIHITDLVTELGKIEEKSENSQTHDMIKLILARQSAIEWKRIGTARLPSIVKIISAEEMMEGDFIELVGTEFEAIKDIEGFRGSYKYNKTEMKNIILSEIAKNVANTYKKVGILDIPQSDNMKEITQEQEEHFIYEIQMYADEITDVEKIREQIRGIRQYQLEDFIKVIEKIPEDERGYYMERLKRQIKTGKKQTLNPKVQKKMDKVIQGISGMDLDDAIGILNNTMEKIEDKIEEREQETQEENEGTYSNKNEGLEI